jgi:3' terminal RNA ribose 2'-O-methyltransferase Hen1
MMLSIACKNLSEEELGFLLHKNPARVHPLDLSFGKVYVFFDEPPEGHQAQVCLLVDVDPLAMVQGRGGLGHQDALYVNDRPYVASSLLASAVTKVFGTALSGRCKERPELVDREIEWTFAMPFVARGSMLNALFHLFEPLGYEFDPDLLNYDSSVDYATSARPILTRIAVRTTLSEALSHLVVLIPVLDGENHRWVDDGDLVPFVRRVESWLPDHPYGMYILRRALKYQTSLVKAFTERFPAITGSMARLPQLEANVWDDATVEAAGCQPLSLNSQRFSAVEAVVSALSPSSIVDLGCGDGSLVSQLVKQTSIQKLVGMDVNPLVLSRARARLEHLSLTKAQTEKIQFIHGSLAYRDPRVKGFDLALLIEVIEHIDAERLETLEHQVFDYGQYSTVVVTTPNREFNDLYVGMEKGKMRHSDHRFEWTRQEFLNWAKRIGDAFGYNYEISEIGAGNPAVGSPTQMAVFSKKAGAPL